MNAADTLKNSNRAFVLDSSNSRRAKHFDDPMLSNRAFAVFFFVTILIAITLLLAPKVQAVSATWNGTTSTAWATTTNWSASPVPGSGDTATFNNAGNGNTTLNLGAGVTINTILFNTASAAAYTIGSGAVGSQTLTLNDGGAITVNSTVTNNETFNANIVLGLTRGTGTYTFTNNSTTSGQLLTIAGNISSGSGGSAGTGKTLALAGAGNGLISGSISGNGGASTAVVSLTKSGAGTWTLSGANSYSGTTAVSAGTLILNGSNSSAGATTVASGSTLQLGAGANGGLASGLLSIGGTVRSTDANPRTISNNVSLTSNTATFGSSGTGALTINGTVDLGVGAGLARTVTTVSNTTFANAVFGNANSGLTKEGSGTLTFSGSVANTYNGTTTVNVGELDLNKTAGVNAIAGNLTIGDGTGTDTVKLLASNQIVDTSDVTINSSGVLNLNNNNETIDGLSSASSTSSVTLGTGTLTVGANDQATATFAGVISGTGGNLVKSGTGTQTLSGNNTYTGTTTISGGTLEIANTGSASSGRISGTSNVTVNSGGTLLLSGSSSWTDRINDSATMTLNGGTFNTGGLSERGGTLAAPTPGIGALTLTATSTIDFGAGNTSIIEFAGIGPHAAISGPNLLIINWDGLTYGGGTERLLFAGTSATFISEFDQSDVSFNGVVGYNIEQFGGFYEVSAIPEPSTWAGAVLAFGVLGWSQRRRLRALVSAPKLA
jgi:fibronectin-binding autotransporter adhesin